MTRRNRRPRPKARKPKYLSLRRYLAPPPPPPLADVETPSPPPPPPPLPEERSASSCCDVASSSAVAPLSGSGAHDDNGKEPQLLEITPLQPPDHLDRDPHVASLLLLDDDNRTLEALFGDDGSAAASSGSPSPASAADSPASSSMNWDGLARRALRGRERWVYCHSSSSSLPAVSSSGDEEASSAGGRSGRRAADLWWRFAATDQSKAQALTLKLDYEEILAAWSDRGPLYIEAEAPQVVPQLHGEPYYAFPVMVEVGPSEAWRVPEFAGAPAASESQRTAGGKGEPEGELEEGEEKRSREERVRRYKEKRRSRLFAKRIRYEVRKLNAEKRPRFKGRFVKRKDEMEDLALSP